MNGDAGKSEVEHFLGPLMGTEKQSGLQMSNAGG